MEKDHLAVRNGQGAERKVTAANARSFDVFERRKIEIAKGEKLLLTANRRDQNFRATNGEMVWVKNFDRKGRIHLMDGRVLPENYGSSRMGMPSPLTEARGKRLIP